MCKFGNRWDCFLKLLVTIVIGISFGMLNAKRPFKKVVSSHGVTVYERTHRSDLLELKARGIIHHPLHRVLDVLLDEKKIQEWQPLESFERLKTYSEYHFINYFAMDLPWPISNRDLVSETKIEVNEKKFYVMMRLKDIKGLKPERKGYVRLPVNEGYWFLKPVNRGESCEVEFLTRGDPGSWIPKWILNWVARKQIVKGFDRLRDRLNKVSKSSGMRSEILQKVRAWPIAKGGEAKSTP